MKKHHKESLLKLNEQFMSSAISIYSGQTAFFLMLSFLPFLLFFFSLLNLTPLTEMDFITWVNGYVPESFRETVSIIAREVYHSSTGRISFTIIIALWLSSKAMVSIQYGLDAMYSIKETRNYFVMRFWGALYSAILAIVLLILLGFAVFGKSLRDKLFPDVDLIANLVALRYVIIIPVLFLLIWLVYAILPNGKAVFRHHVIGAAFAAIAWVVFSFAFSIYVDYFCNYASIYGTMTTIALIMLWIYGCMYVLFLGGFINRLISERFSHSK